MAVPKLCFGSYLLLFSLFPVSDGAVTNPPDQEACVGDNVTIPWEYDDANIFSVFWRVNSSTNVMEYYGTTRDPVNGYNVVASNDNGSMTITSATRSNSGTYRIDITATQTTSDEVEVLICEPSEAGLEITKSGSELTCEASNLGDPEAELYIKVNGEKKNSSSAEVSIFNIVECCLSGCAVQCMSAKNESCEVVQIFPWWIILLIVVAILYATGLVIGIIKWILQLKHKTLCEEFCEKYCDVPGKKDDVLKWCFFIFLCVTIVGLGLMTVWLIRRCFGGGSK